MPALSSWTTVTDYKPIDLGTDVGGKRIYWASRNVGATADVQAEDTDASCQTTLGDYFAWGETVPKYTADPYGSPTWAEGKSEGYDWVSYFDTDNSGSSFKKYAKDNKMVLDLEDDAAAQNVKMGGNAWIWRMPTDAEWTALIGDESNWAWDDTKKGQTVTNMGGTAWTDPTVFLPAAGYWYVTYFYNEGSVGFYWSSSLGNKSGNARGISSRHLPGNLLQKAPVQAHQQTQQRSLLQERTDGSLGQRYPGHLRPLQRERPPQAGIRAGKRLCLSHHSL